jgi:hypothetical protein
VDQGSGEAVEHVPVSANIDDHVSISGWPRRPGAALSAVKVDHLTTDEGPTTI